MPPKLLVVDQSLKGPGGHHFDYSFQVARAAVESGFSVRVATHRRFRSPAAFPSCEVSNVFQFTTYASSSRTVGIREMVSRRPKSLFRRIADLWRRTKPDSVNEDRSRGASIFEDDESSWMQRDRQKRIASFADDCRQLEIESLGPADHIFFTTLSDLESEGLVQFLATTGILRDPRRSPQWHLQFHFPIFQGRTPEYEMQAAQIQRLAPTFAKLHQVSQQLPMKFYVTSATLKEQYDRLGLTFTDLPYPIAREFQRQKHSEPPRKKPSYPEGLSQLDVVKIAFAGATRKEKGAPELAEIVESTSAESSRKHVTPGPQVRFLVQSKAPSGLAKMKQAVSRLWGRRSEKQNVPESWQKLVDEVPYPLPPSEYRRFIQESDIGLLTTYDAETYFSRRAGILGEYLAAGVPVIVPAGSWLADQIETPRQFHLQDLFQTVEEELRPAAIHHRSGGSTVAEFKLPRSMNFASQELESGNVDSTEPLCLLRFTISQPSEHGHYFRITPHDRKDLAEIVGQSRQPRELFAAFRWSALKSPSSLVFHFENAYRCRSWQIDEVRCGIVSGGLATARSSVGLIAAESSQTPRLIQEMVRELKHYRVTAQAFAKRWARQHDALRTFNTLVTAADESRGQANRRATEAA